VEDVADRNKFAEDDGMASLQRSERDSAVLREKDGGFDTCPILLAGQPLVSRLWG